MISSVDSSSEAINSSSFSIFRSSLLLSFLSSVINILFVLFHSGRHDLFRSISYDTHPCFYCICYFMFFVKISQIVTDAFGQRPSPFLSLSKNT
eukprot:UN04845